MLELSVDFDRDEYQQDEPIQGTFTLRNTGSEPVLVNGRLALNAPFAPPRYREVALNMTDPAGQPLKFMAKVNLGGAQDKHFKLLQPGEAVQHTYPLRSYFSFSQAGIYAVEAVYQNQAEPSQANGHQAWKGEVKSSPTQLTVRG